MINKRVFFGHRSHFSATKCNPGGISLKSKTNEPQMSQGLNVVSHMSHTLFACYFSQHSLPSRHRVKISNDLDQLLRWFVSLKKRKKVTQPEWYVRPCRCIMARRILPFFLLVLFCHLLFDIPFLNGTL